MPANEKKKRRKIKETDKEGGMEVDDKCEIEENEEDEDVEEEDEEMEIAQEGVESLDLSEGSGPAQDTSDDIFKVTVAPQTVGSEPASTTHEGSSSTIEEQFWPSARMNTSLTVINPASILLTKTLRYYTSLFLKKKI